MYCLEVHAQSTELQGVSAVHMFLASLPHGLREVWIESNSGRQHSYTDLVVGNRGTGDFGDRSWSAYWKPELRRLQCLTRCIPQPFLINLALTFWCVSDRVNRPTNKNDVSTRLCMATTPVKFLFSVVELLVALRNIKEHYETTVPDIGGFVRSNYPFLLSHVWHVRSFANSHFG